MPFFFSRGLNSAFRNGEAQQGLKLISFPAEETIIDVISYENSLNQTVFKKCRLLNNWHENEAKVGHCGRDEIV